MLFVNNLIQKKVKKRKKRNENLQKRNEKKRKEELYKIEPTSPLSGSPVSSALFAIERIFK
jgi:hypothetical protein